MLQRRVISRTEIANDGGSRERQTGTLDLVDMVDMVAIPAHGAIGAWPMRRWSVATGSHAGAWEPGRSVNWEMKDALNLTVL